MLAAIVTSSQDAIISKDLNGIISSWNEGACRTFGYTVEEVVGRSITLLIPRDRQDEGSEILARIRRGERVEHYETKRQRKDGSLLDVSLTISPIKDAQGRIIGASKIARDITERKQTEQALRDSEQRFRMVADNISQLAWTCDRLGNVTWYNQRWLDYTGLSFEGMKDWGWKEVHHPDHVDRVVASVTRSRESGEPWDDTFPLRGKDGEYRWFLSRAVPIRDGAGQIVRWFGTNTDVTAQRHADETRQMLTNELSHRVKNMLATVQAIATQTLRHNKDTTTFVSKFGGRIQSMSRIHAMLANVDWQGAELGDVIRDQLLLGAV